MKTLLLTGFDVWGPHAVNSSWEMIRDAAPPVPAGWQVVIAQLPVSWERAPRVLEAHLTSEVKAAVCFGMAGGETLLVERMAVNLAAPARDVDGELPPSDLVCPDGPPAYWTGLPRREVVTALRGAGLACTSSPHAGTFLCNCAFYRLMHHIATHRPDLIGGFIHVPPLEGMTREVLRSAVGPVVRVVTTSVDAPENELRA